MLDEFHPYVGPRPFESKLEDQRRFFGRDREVNEVASLIISHPVTLVYAQSGAGKTSLMNARLIPLLEAKGFEVLPRPRMRDELPDEIRPDNVFSFNALKTWAGEKADASELASMSLADFLKERTHFTDSEGRSLPRITIFDQFEELFTFHQDYWPHRRAFFEQVRAALDQDRLLRVVFVMREDYIAELDPFELILPERFRTRFRLERLRPKAALSAVTGPLTVSSLSVHREFAPGVAEKLIDSLLEIPNKVDVAGNPLKGEFVEPVQLQVVCQSLWDNLGKSDKQITEAHLKQFGDVTQALTKFFETSLSEAVSEANKRKRHDEPELHEGTLRGWFDRTLITETGKRSTVFRGNRFTEGIPNAAVDVLEAKHLLRAELRDGERWYELSHDRFLHPIRDSYKRWLLEQPGAEQTRLRLEEKAAAWYGSAKAPDLLLNAGEVLEARRWLDSPDSAGVAYSDKLLAFVNASEAAIERAERERDRELAIERQRRMRQLKLGFVGLSILLFLMAGVTAFAFQQKGAAVSARAEAETQRREALRQRDLAVLASAEATQGRKDAEEQRGFAIEAKAQAEQQADIAEAAKAEAASAAATAKFEAEAARQAETLEAGQRRLAESRVIASVASNVLSQPFFDPEVSALLGLEAAELAPSGQALDVLRSSLAQMSHTRARLAAHNETVNTVAFNADGKRLVTASNDGTVRVWDADGRALAVLAAEGVVEAAVVSPDGKFILATQNQTSSRDIQRSAQLKTRSVSRTLNVWDAATLTLLVRLDAGKLEQSVPISDRDDVEKRDIVFSRDGKLVLIFGEADIRAWEVGTWRMAPGFPRSGEVVGSDSRLENAAISPDGKYALLRSSDFIRKLVVMELSSGKQVGQIDELAAISSAAFSPNSKLIATVSKDSVSVWEWATGRALLNHVGEPNMTGVSGVTFSHDSQFIVTKTNNGTARIWNVTPDDSPLAMGLPPVGLSGHTGSIVSAVFSPDGALVLTASLDGTARLWDAKTGASLAELRGHTAALTEATFSPDGSIIATASADKTARIWNTLGEPGVLQIAGQDAVFSPGGTYVAAKTEGGFAVWDVKTGLKLWSRDCAPRIRRESFSPDDNYLTAICRSEQRSLAYIFKTRTGDVAAALPVGYVAVSDDAIFSPDGKHVLTFRDRSGTIWDLNGKTLASFVSRTNTITAVFSPDGKFVLGATGDEVVQIWDARTGKELESSPNVTDRPQSFAFFSPDGNYVASISAQLVYVWKRGTDKYLTLDCGDRPVDEGEGVVPGVNSRSFSPDSKLIVTPCENDSACVWDLETGMVKATLAKHTGEVIATEFSPDGRSVVTSSNDGTARVWRTGTWQSVAVLRGHNNAVYSATFGGSGGSSVLTSSSDGTSRVFQSETFATLDELKALAPQRITRRPQELTVEERERYLSDLGLGEQAKASRPLRRRRTQSR